MRVTAKTHPRSTHTNLGNDPVMSLIIFRKTVCLYNRNHDNMALTSKNLVKFSNIILDKYKFQKFSTEAKI